MQYLLALIRHDEVHAVGLLNTDRLSGEMAQKLAILDIAKKNDVKLLSVQNPIESGPEGEGAPEGPGPFDRDRERQPADRHDPAERVHGQRSRLHARRLPPSRPQGNPRIHEIIHQVC